MSSTNSLILRSTLFHIVIPANYIYDRENEESVNVDYIKKCLRKYSTIVEWALILHDKDVYTDKKELVNGGKIGDPKPPHYHLLIRSDNYNWMNVKSVAKWFRIPENFIDKPEKGGVRGFNIQLMYLTHTSRNQRSYGKFIYSIDEIISNVQDLKFRLEIIEKNRKSKEIIEDAKRLAYTGNYSPNEICNMYNISENMKWVREVSESYNLGKENRKKDEEMKVQRMELPPIRINTYVFGCAGSGKTMLCDTLAYSLYPDVKYDNRVFNTSSENASVKEYSNQPVVIWDECTSDKLLKDTGGQGNLLKIFRTHPRKESVNVKFGTVILSNKYNFVNSTEDFDYFIKNLADDSDISQYQRRFPVYIKMDMNRLSLFLDSRVYDKKLPYGIYEEKIHFDLCIGEICGSLSIDETMDFISDILNRQGVLKIYSDIEKYLMFNQASKEEKLALADKYGVSKEKFIHD